VTHQSLYKLEFMQNIALDAPLPVDLIHGTLSSEVKLLGREANHRPHLV
jgi:hypothetical protein